MTHHYLPVFLARLNKHGGVSFQYPSVNVNALTNEAPHGWDGGTETFDLPAYPCLVISALDVNTSLAPNEVIYTKEQADEYKAGLLARHFVFSQPKLAKQVFELEMKYTFSQSTNDLDREFETHLAALKSNKERGDKARARFKELTQ